MKKVSVKLKKSILFFFVFLIANTSFLYLVKTNANSRISQKLMLRKYNQSLPQLNLVKSGLNWSIMHLLINHFDQNYIIQVDSIISQKMITQFNNLIGEVEKYKKRTSITPTCSFYETTLNSPDFNCSLYDRFISPLHKLNSDRAKELNHKGIHFLFSNRDKLFNSNLTIEEKLKKYKSFNNETSKLYALINEIPVEKRSVGQRNYISAIDKATSTKYTSPKATVKNNLSLVIISTLLSFGLVVLMNIFLSQKKKLTE